MSNNTLTSEEKRCLQMWFRQAIARLEQDEALSSLLQNDIETVSSSHHKLLGRRRLHRVRQALHHQETLV